jgi:hypothetical protein
MIELSEQTADLGLIGELFPDPHGGKPVENSKLLLAESLIDHNGVGVFVKTRSLDDETGSVARAQVRRGENDGGSILRWQRSEPVSERNRLAFPQLGERDVDVADAQVYDCLTSLQRRTARDISGRLAVANDVKQVRPDLVFFHAQKQVKERTNSDFLRSRMTVVRTL